MTAFEKSLLALDEDALRAGAEELLTLLVKADGGQRGVPGKSGGQKPRDAAAARVSTLIAAGASPEKRGGETATEPAVAASASDGAVPKTVRARRAYPKTDGVRPAAEESAREEDETLPEPASPGMTAGKDRGARKKRKNREDREAPADRENRDDPEGWNDREERRDRVDREEQETPIQAPGTQDGETVDREEAQALEKQLQSVSQQRRGRVRQSGGDGAHTAAFRGPERQYEGAVGARGTEMRRISDYFRRDSRRYDTGFTTY